MSSVAVTEVLFLGHPVGDAAWRFMLRMRWKAEDGHRGGCCFRGWREDNYCFKGRLLHCRKSGGDKVCRLPGIRLHPAAFEAEIVKGVVKGVWLCHHTRPTIIHAAYYHHCADNCECADFPSAFLFPGYCLVALRWIHPDSREKKNGAELSGMSSIV